MSDLLISITDNSISSLLSRHHGVLVAASLTNVSSEPQSMHSLSLRLPPEMTQTCLTRYSRAHKKPCVVQIFKQSTYSIGIQYTFSLSRHEHSMN